MVGVMLKQMVNKIVRTVCAALLVASVVLLANSARAQDPVAAGTSSGSTARDLIGDAVSKDTDLKLVDEAINLFKNRDIDGARAKLQEAKKQIPKLPPAELLMARMLFAANQTDGARASVEKTILDYPNDPEAYILMAELCLQNRLVTPADLLLDKAEKLVAAFTENPDRLKNFKQRVLSGQATVAEARAAAATPADAKTLWDTDIAKLKAWIALDPNSALAQTRLGNALFFKGEVTPGALDAYKAALKLDNKLPNPGITIAMLTENKPLVSTTPAAQQDEKGKNHDAAKKWMDWALNPANAIKSDIISKPDDLKTHQLNSLLMAGNWALQTNEIAYALQVAEKAVALDPKSLDAKLLRGMVARFNGDATTAEKNFQAAFDQSPGHFGASNQLAIVLVESKDPDKKRRGLDLATVNARQYSKNTEAVSTYGWALYQLDQKQQALQALQAVAQTGQLTADSAYYAAVILNDMKDPNNPTGNITGAIQLLEAAGTTAQPFVHRTDAQTLLAQLKKLVPAAGGAPAGGGPPAGGGAPASGT